MFEVYEVRRPSKITTIRADANHASNDRKIKGIKDNTPNRSEKSHPDKRNKKYAGHPSNEPTGDKTFHGPVHSTEECKVLRKYPKKYAAQYPHQ